LAFPDVAEFIIGRAFARPGGSSGLQAARYDDLFIFLIFASVASIDIVSSRIAFESNSVASF
jgi:hypothetical protein